MNKGDRVRLSKYYDVTGHSPDVKQKIATRLGTIATNSRTPGFVFVHWDGNKTTTAKKYRDYTLEKVHATIS